MEPLLPPVGIRALLYSFIYSRLSRQAHIAMSSEVSARRQGHSPFQIRKKAQALGPRKSPECGEASVL